MDSTIMRMLVLRGLKYGLKALKSYMSTEDFREVVDLVLDKVEDYFKDGSTADKAVEYITADIR